MAGAVLRAAPVFAYSPSSSIINARVLGSAGFTRGDEEIIRDITKPFDPDAPQMVSIELECEGEIIAIEHEVGVLCPELSSFYVFDSTSVIEHLAKKNKISFTPSGLSYLQDLAGLTDSVREAVKNRIESESY